MIMERMQGFVYQKIASVKTPDKVTEVLNLDNEMPCHDVQDIAFGNHSITR